MDFLRQENRADPTSTQKSLLEIINQRYLKPKDGHRPHPLDERNDLPPHHIEEKYFGGPSALEYFAKVTIVDTCLDEAPWEQIQAAAGLGLRVFERLGVTQQLKKLRVLNKLGSLLDLQKLPGWTSSHNQAFFNPYEQVADFIPTDLEGLSMRVGFANKPHLLIQALVSVNLLERTLPKNSLLFRSSP